MKIVEYINWEKIRLVGELSLLTNISYLMLILVPLIASFWPSIRVAVNHYNINATAVITTMEQAHINLLSDINELQYLSSNLQNKANVELAVFNDPITSIKTKLAKNIETLKELSFKVKEPNLPLAWLFMFLAAFSISIAQSIYQCFAPEVVKKYRKIEFVNYQKNNIFKFIKNVPSNDQGFLIASEAESTYSEFSTSGSMSAKVCSFVLYIIGLISILIVIIIQLKNILQACGVN